MYSTFVIVGIIQESCSPSLPWLCVVSERKEKCKCTECLCYNQPIQCSFIQSDCHHTKTSRSASRGQSSDHWKVDWYRTCKFTLRVWKQTYAYLLAMSPNRLARWSSLRRMTMNIMGWNMQVRENCGICIPA